MSAGRIDHVTRAENAMQNGIKTRNAGDMAEAMFQATLAQAAATVALVEQQRIANLIALVALSGNENVQESSYDEGSTLSSAGMHALIEYVRTPGTPISDPDDVPVIRAEIQEALGLS